VSVVRTWRKSVLDYWQSSKHPFYALLSVFPVLLFYELIALTLNQQQQIGIRNAADVIIKNIIIKQLMETVGIHGLFAYGLIVLVVLGILFWQRYRNKNLSFQPTYFVIMFIESLVYAVFLGPLVGYFTNLLQHFMPLTHIIDQLSLTHKVMLSLGAGFYEELVFRVILLSGSVFLLVKFLNLSRSAAVVIASLFSSVVFSAFHYLGPFGEPFQIYSFVFRFLAGIIFAILYILRGFGIAVYTHTLYDLLIIMYQ